MRIFVSAAEISSDLHAAKIVRALLEHHPEGGIEVFGIGGPSLRSIPGFVTWEQAENLRAMGFTEVLSKLRELRRIRDRVLSELKRNPPEVILTFDYPEFHLSLMEGVAGVPELSGALKICGIPPKVWVWRQHRVERIRALYDGVWTILPFERDFYESRGIPVLYEGNPLIADLFREGDPVKTPWLSDSEVRIAVMPGSREAELKQHLKVIPKALQELSGLSGKRIHAEVPVPSGVGEALIRRELASTDRVHYSFFKDGSHEVLARNSLGLIKSGTSTLEAAVLGCVPVIFYKVSPLSEFIFHFIVRYSGPVGLPNILLGAKRKIDAPFQEWLGVDATSEALAVGLNRLIEDASRLRELQNRGASLKESLVPVRDVPAAVAARISEWIEKRPVSLRIPPRKRRIAALSWLWSVVNGLRRSAVRHGVGKVEPLPLPAVLVGNLQAGGTGKTPVVIELARGFMERGRRVGIITRGYGGRISGRFHLASASDPASLIGDEACEMLDELPGVLLGVDADRVRAAHELKRVGAEVLVLDDGFQNLGFEPKVTLLLVTDLDRDRVLYRDFDSQARHADFLFQAKGRSTSRFGKAVPIEWVSAPLPGKPLWILCGVGDPEEVRRFYQQAGARVDRLFSLPDHAEFDPEWVRHRMIEAESQGAILAVTPKDRVKLPTKGFEGLWVLRRRMADPSVLDGVWDRLDGLQ
jgi:lipid-A-disaccharide synthase